MKEVIQRTDLARLHAAHLQTLLVLQRWRSGCGGAMPQTAWLHAAQQGLTAWLERGGLAQEAGIHAAAAETKTAAMGRRSLASQRDSNEEYQFSLLRIVDAAE